MRIDRFFRTLLAAVAGVMAATSCAMAQSVDTPSSLAGHEQIDAALGMLSGPVWKPVRFNRDNAPGAISTSPFYKQQPPGAQEDFRLPASPTTPVVAPAPPREPDRGDSARDDPEPEIVTPAPPPNEPGPITLPDDCEFLVVLCF